VGIAERAAALRVRAAAAGFGPGTAAEQRQAKRAMKDRGVSRRAFEAIAELVPLAYVLANLATVSPGRGHNPGGLCAEALWNDDADWLAGQREKREAAAVLAKIAEERQRAEAEARRRDDDDRAAQLALVAHLTDDEITAAAEAHAARLDGARARALRGRLSQTDPRRSRIVVAAAIEQLNLNPRGAACAAIT
jgi:uncharacterized protein YdaU (DUF1376 family)